jgi:hypothetical protein
LAAFLERGETLLDFVVNRETSCAGLRENQPAIDDNVKLPRLTGFDFGLFAESGIK